MTTAPHGGRSELAAEVRVAVPHRTCLDRQGGQREVDLSCEADHSYMENLTQDTALFLHVGSSSD